MTKPSRRSSVASALFRARPLRLALPALAVLVGFGLFVSGCGDDPAPTTPTPAPTPTPTPTPPPAVPTGLTAASTGPDYIEWTWTAVEGATAYDVQVSQTAENDFTRNTQSSVDTGTSHRAGNLPEETTRWARVRAKSANGESDWSDAVSGTTMKAPLMLTAPTGLRVAVEEPRFIEWTWNVVVGATAYEVQTREGNANFAASDRIENAPATASPKWRKTVEPETTHYLRVRAVAGTGADRVEGDWALPVEGESPILPIGIPANLRVAAKGEDFIEWEWDPVEGATSYNVRLDLTSPYTFNPPSDTSPEITMTKWRKTRLDDGELVHAQVRANAGTAPNQRRGEWSQSVSTTTDERQPEPIGTPTGLDADNPTRTQVSLDWNDVTNAETYEVQQRAGSSGSWGNATCDESDDNEVEASECTATGLESGTAYQFRVRAVPVDDDDDLLTESAWSSPVSATTTGRATGGTDGGGGALNITWRSTQTAITWRWDQAGREVDFQISVLTGVLDTAAPCEDRSVTWLNADFSNSHTVDNAADSTLAASSARLLCVRTVTTDSDGDATYGDPSWSWAATAPGNASPATDEAVYKDDLTGNLAGETEALVWNASFANLPHFDYDIRYFVDEEEKDNDDWEAPASGAEQRTCSAADLTEEISPSGAAGTTFTSGIDLEPYAAYRMCYRAVNDDGASNWTYNFTAPIHTRPIKPAVGQGVPRASTNAAGDPVNNGDNFRVAWAVTTNANAPRADSSATDLLADYTVRMARSTTARTETAVRDQCQDGSSGNGFLIQAAAVGDGRIKPPSTASSSFNVWYRFPNGDAANRLHYYLCVRTLDVRTSAPGVGSSPWVVSPGVTHGGSN